MTSTTRNRSAILAAYLRAALTELRMAGVPRTDTVGARQVFTNGINVVAAVAEELEAVAAAPDPAPGELRG